MKDCIIVGASSDVRHFKYDNDDFIIASDGGYKFLKENNYPISLVVGDFDSLGYVPDFKDVIKLNVDKDITDSHASIEEGIKRGFKSFKIYGCTGGRIDLTLALIQDAYNFVKLGYNIEIYSLNQTIKLIYNSKIELFNDEGKISIFSLSEISKGVTLTNLKYELVDAILKSSYPLGVSNEFINNKKATIEVKDGCLVIIY